MVKYKLSQRKGRNYLKELLRAPVGFPGIDISPERDKMVFVANLEGRYEIYLLNLITHKLKKLTDNIGMCSFPTFSPDGTKIVFTLNKTGRGNNSIVVISLKKGSLINVIESPDNKAHPVWAPDGERIFFLSDKEKGIMNIWMISLRDGSIQKVTESDRPIWNFTLSHNGEIIVFITGHIRDYQLFWMRLGDRRVNKFKVTPGTIFYPLPLTLRDNFSPDDSKFAFAAMPEDKLDIGIFSFENEKIEWIVKGENNKKPLGFSPKGKRIAYTEYINEEYRLKIKSMREGEVEDISVGRGSHSFGRWLTEDKLLVLFASPISPPEFWIVDRLGSRKITSFTPPSIPIEELVEPESIRYKSFDGLEIPALLYCSKSSEHKGLIWIHGGPNSYAFKYWNPYMQFLVSNGYNILIPNFRGSDAYGRRFLNLNFRDWGGGDLKDIIWGAQWMEKNGFIKEERIGIFGESYGGYLTLMALSLYPEKWRAGVSICGIADLRTDYKNTTGSLRYVLESRMGKPDESPLLYKERSPITHIHKIKAPLLLFHGENDPKVPLEEAEQIKEKLREKCELIVYPGEGHGISKKENKIDMFQKIIAFFNNYV